MSYDNNVKRSGIYQLKWFGIFFATGIVIFYLLPFPVDLVVALGALILIRFLRVRSSMKRRYGARNRIKDLFSPPPSQVSGSQYRQMKYYCMSCRKEHRDQACPNCGSKMKRAS